MRERGHTLVELIVVVAILVGSAMFGIPALRAYSIESRVLGPAREFKGKFRYARAASISSGAATAIRFERTATGARYSVYRDGNGNGVLAADIRSGRDIRLAGPFELTGGAPGVTIAVVGKVPEIAPESGSITPGDGLRFSNDMISFSPLGTATPGTLYLAGGGLQTAVRVTPSTGRVRLLLWHGGRWQERP